MGPVLAIETSVATARVAVLTPGGACLAARERTAARTSVALLPLCDETLRAAGLGVADLGAIACGSGPGSFTGLRVGLAVAKGLALTTALPLVMVSSLEALAHDLAAPSGTLVVPCLDAGKAQVYAQLFRNTERVEPISEAWVLAPEALCEHVQAVVPQVVLGGTGVDRYLELFRTALGIHSVRAAVPGPSALAVGRLALASLDRGEHDDLATVVPCYGRPPDITQPKRTPLGSTRRSG